MFYSESGRISTNKIQFCVRLDYLLLDEKCLLVLLYPSTTRGHSPTAVPTKTLK